MRHGFKAVNWNFASCLSGYGLILSISWYAEKSGDKDLFDGYNLFFYNFFCEGTMVFQKSLRAAFVFCLFILTFPIYAEAV
jgi:hypothetical protein